MSKRRAPAVVLAHGRLKGALQDVANVAEEDEDNDASKPNRGRPPKRVKKEPTPPPPQPSVQHSFLMKLFERCVDLAKYNENTALYPICRAWIINQPRSNQFTNYRTRKEPIIPKREPMPDLLDEIKSGKVTEVTEMPISKYVDVPRIPSRTALQKKSTKDNINLEYDADKPQPDRKELMAGLKERWCGVRKNWLKHAKEYEEQKFGDNVAILEAVYKK